MKVFEKIVDLQNQLFEDRKQGKEIGLVPTMGALHEGHASLVRRSVAENGITVVSVFVNPTQFNDKNDLKNYPRTLEADCKLLEACGADYVLAPSVEECILHLIRVSLNILQCQRSWRVLIVLVTSMVYVK